MSTEPRPAAENERPLLDLADMEKWVLDHGSPRLHKALEAGLLDVSKGAYRGERLALERNGWRYLEDWELKLHRKIHNPTEEALDALLGAREDSGTMRLVWRQPKETPGEPWLVDEFCGRIIGISVADYLLLIDGSSS